MKNFKDWLNSSEGKAINEEVPTQTLEVIWSAAKVSALNNFTSLIHKGILQINPQVKIRETLLDDES